MELIFIKIKKEMKKKLLNGNKIELYFSQEKKETPGIHMRVMENLIDWL